MLEDAILVRRVNLEATLGEHADEGYARFDDVHELLGTHLNVALIAFTLAVHGYIEVKVDLDL